jgi:hypothetical protein
MKILVAHDMRFRLDSEFLVVAVHQPRAAHPSMPSNSNYPLMDSAVAAENDELDCDQQGALKKQNCFLTLT